MTNSMLEAKMKLDDAVWLANLAEWIERARNLCDDVMACANNGGTFAAALDAENIAYANANWGADQSDGLVRLVAIQKKLMSDAIATMEASHV